MTLRILYVEDNEDNVFMLSSRLRKRGYQVDVAVDGRRGVARARDTQPDLILMDLGLPVLDGWEATHQLKSDDATATIPIIVLTAHAMPSEIERALAAGAEDCDTKPVSLKRLLKKIEDLIGPGDAVGD